MSCFLEILQCIPCFNEGGKRERDGDEDFPQIPSPPRLDPWVSRPRSSPSSYTPINLPVESPRAAATVVVESSSESAQKRISPDPNIRKPIDERITPFSSAYVVSNGQSQTMQPSAISTLSVTSMPSPSVSEKNSANVVRAPSYLDRPKQPPASTSVSDPPKKSSGSSAPSMLDPPKKLLTSPSAPALPLKSLESVDGLDTSGKLIGTASPSVETAKKSSQTFAPSISLSPMKLVGPTSAEDPPKKPPASMAGVDSPKAPSGTTAGQESPKKSSGSMAGPDPPKQQPNLPKMVIKPRIRLPTNDVPENFEDAIKKDEVPQVPKQADPRKQQPHSREMVWKPKIKFHSYEIPENFDDAVKKDEVPEVLKLPDPPKQWPNSPEMVCKPKIRLPTNEVPENFEDATKKDEVTEAPKQADPQKQLPNSQEMVWKPKAKLPAYEIPENFENAIKKDEVPEVLKLPDPQNKWPNSPEMFWKPKIRLPTYEILEKFEDTIRKDEVPEVIKLSDPPKQWPNSPEMIWKPIIRLPTYEIPEKFEDATKTDEVPEVLKLPDGPDPPKQWPNSPEMVWKPNIRLPTYEIPENFEDAIKRDEVPEVLKQPLSPSTYRDYFAALLYAEDYYLEKWSDFLLYGVTLELHEESKSHKSRKSGRTVFSFEQTNEVERVQKEKWIYVAFEVDSIPERRPYLLSRDFVFVQPQGKNVQFKGIVSRVVKSTCVLVEFGHDFHSQHSSKCKYDVSFSFNRVCLKRSHQAIEAAMNPLFRNLLFPNTIPRTRHFIPTSLPRCQDLDAEQISIVYQMISLKGPPPYLVVYQSSSRTSQLRVEEVILEAILHAYRSSKDNRILIVAPRNIICDYLMSSLKKEIPEDEMFRANAAFRGYEDVSVDILTSCLYEGECFTCPSLEDLCKFKVITSTFVSSFRLHNAGINAGHFTHIFIHDASFATEPDMMIALANLADETTAVVMTGSWGNRPDRVRADIARENGLKTSYFERLLTREPYSGDDPAFVARL